MKIFNILGEEIAILIYACLEAGSPFLICDVAGLSSEFYSYRLTAGFGDGITCHLVITITKN